MKFIFFVLVLICLFLSACENIQIEGEIPLNMPMITPEFVVLPGDALKIMVFQKPELTQQETVRPDGKIRLLMVGELSAKGKTLSQIQQEISKKLEKYLKNPEVEVSLVAPNFLIYLFGEVARRGPISARENITLLEALITSGGFTNFSDKSKIVVIRRVPGKEIRYRFNLFTYLSGENIQQNIYLQPRDIIYVPMLPF
ncbi:MAG: polysaccharide biosynthesis/export family protein [Candidatus Brocadiae bacterium]|nr:polysaccharide biosynthesis/export family protein [Candidatus Brocadiia bacterium]